MHAKSKAFSASANKNHILIHFIQQKPKLAHSKPITLPHSTPSAQPSKKLAPAPALYYTTFMNNKPTPKATVDQIRQRFDSDVDRFSNLQTGQTSTIDAALAMDLITQAAHAVTTPIRNILDIGCGAGNNTLKLLQLVPDANCTLLDLSQPMLQRAQQRVTPCTTGTVTLIQSDIRTADLPAEGYDIILAAAVLHHLRDDADWQAVFAKLHRLLRPGGSLWITDLVAHDNPAIDRLMQQRYADYLTALGGADYCQQVFDYIAQEDTPRSIPYQLDLLRQSGFRQVELLHKNTTFAAYGAIK